MSIEAVDDQDPDLAAGLIRKVRGRAISPLKPYRQGELDGLCGIYATINAIRLALKDRAERFTPDDCQSLFNSLIVATDEVVGAVAATGWGISPKPLRRIIKIAAEHMADEHDLKLAVSRVLKRKDRLPIEEVLPRLAQLVEEPGSTIIVSFSGHLDHWTVLRRVGATTLQLFDSSGLARLNIANCRMSYEPAAATKREHIIHPQAVLRIALGVEDQR